jgi:arginase
MCLVLGGDHSIASGSLHGQLLNYSDDLKVVWIDAHADLNNLEGSPSLNYHGMSAGHVMGTVQHGEIYGFDWLTKNLKPSNVAYIGLRDLDQFEKEYLRYRLLGSTTLCITRPLILTWWEVLVQS